MLESEFELDFFGFDSNIFLFNPTAARSKAQASAIALTGLQRIMKVVKAKVLVQEEQANAVAERANAIAADAQKDLDAVMPEFKSAVKAVPPRPASGGVFSVLCSMHLHHAIYHQVLRSTEKS